MRGDVSPMLTEEERERRREEFLKLRQEKMKEALTMPMNETVHIHDAIGRGVTSITRVPGGWLYRFRYVHMRLPSEESAPVFVAEVKGTQ